MNRPGDFEQSEADMYRTMNRWGGGGEETRCGRSSKFENTIKVREVLPAWVEKYNILTLNDAGAGDLNWFKTLLLPIEVRHYDLIVRHERVTQWDIAKAALPPADAILCRYVLNHLNVDRVLAALGFFRESAEYLIATDFTSEQGSNKFFWKYDLTAAPFNLGTPLERVADDNGDLCLWKLK